MHVFAVLVTVQTTILASRNTPRSPNLLYPRPAGAGSERFGPVWWTSTLFLVVHTFCTVDVCTCTKVSDFCVPRECVAGAGLPQVAEGS